MTGDERLSAIKECIEAWASRQGQDRCWYYPEIFKLVAKLCGATVDQPKHLPPRKEFEAGCNRYADEEYVGVCEYCGGSGYVLVETGRSLSPGVVGPVMDEVSCRWCWRAELKSALKK